MMSLRSPPMRIPFFLFASILYLHPGAATAATYCVSDAAGFIAALEQSAASDENDVIRVVGSNIELQDPVDLSVRGDLTIRGGYLAGCSLSFPLARSVISGTGAESFNLRPRLGNLTLARLSFTGFSGVIISDQSTPSAVRSGEILVQRCGFIGNQSGLTISSYHHDVRVENSLFVDSSNEGGNIFNGAGFILRGSVASSPETRVRLVNNTSVGNKIGFTLDSGGDGSGSPNAVVELYNNVIAGNRSTDLVLRRPILARNNIWVSQDFAVGALLQAGSLANLAEDPELDANWRPIAPNSPAINSGQNQVPGGLASLDYGGATRLVGTRVDRGAYESNVNNSPLLTVTNTNNSGSGSLRQAILDANTSPLEKTIVFDIPGACPRIIAPTTSLPALTAPVVIDGYTQPGSQLNESAQAFDGVLCVALDGGGVLATGLDLQTSQGQSMRVEGMAFYGFSSEAVRVSGLGSADLRGNAFGTGAAGHNGGGFADAAIRVTDAMGTTIGGNDPAARNVIGRAAQVGIRLQVAGGSRSVRGNLIGFDLDGVSPLPNGFGITVATSFGDVITRNRIGFSTTHGLRLNSGAGAPQDVIISLNDFGWTATGSAAGNGGNAIRVEGGQGHNIEYNSIGNSGTDGVVVLAASRRVRILNNTITQNAQQAIDLSPDGVNPIDLDVGAVGANDGQNYPTLLEASGAAQTGRVRGVLESKNGTFLVQFFRNNECDANGFGEARAWIGQVNVTIVNAGQASNGSAIFQADVFSAPSLMGRPITAIATDSQGNSSEVSACITYTQGTGIFRNGFE